LRVGLHEKSWNKSIGCLGLHSGHGAKGGT
jgi:hypothetical protein